MKPAHFLILLLILLAMPPSSFASYSIGPADVGFPGENKAFTCWVRLQTIPNNALGTEKRVYDITLTVPSEMRGRALNMVQLLSDEAHPEDFEISLQASKINNSQFSVNVRISEAFSRKFVIRARYKEGGALGPLDMNARISSAESGYEISIADQIDKFNRQK